VVWETIFVYLICKRKDKIYIGLLAVFYLDYLLSLVLGEKAKLSVKEKELREIQNGKTRK